MRSETQPVLARVNSTWTNVVERYEQAQAQQAASSIETNTELLEDGGVRFVLKIAAALRDKPKPPAPSGGEKKEWRNPFLPYDEALWVQHLSPTHTLLLNKFNVVAHHVLVVTRQFESQRDPLNAQDMEATWAVLQAMPHGGLAFYNCGPQSGASQPHKHVQLVPLPLEGASLHPSSTAASDTGTRSPSSSSQGGSEDPGPPIWAAVAGSLQGAAPGQVVQLASLPFAAFGVALPPAAEVTPQLLADAFAAALDRCRGFVAAQASQQQQQRSPGGEAAHHHLESGSSGGGSADTVRPGEGFSYNMLLTRRFLLLVPRSAEADGPVSCNSVAFAGSFFVRSREELEYVKGRGPMAVLTAVGFPWSLRAAEAQS
ncbi:hypothetical protein N2152v2_006170 [Parachlorella kessleri]